MAARSRGPNSGRASSGRDGETPYVNLAWGNEQDAEFEKWVSTSEGADPMTCLRTLLHQLMNVKVGTFKESAFCTIESPEAKEAEHKYLLSGWSDGWEEAVQVAFFKWDKLMLRNWEHPTSAVAKSRRH